MFVLECPCDKCERKVEDEWGYLCNIACGRRSAWRNEKHGAGKMKEYIKEELTKYRQPMYNHTDITLIIPIDKWREILTG